MDPESAHFAFPPAWARAGPQIGRTLGGMYYLLGFLASVLDFLFSSNLVQQRRSEFLGCPRRDLDPFHRFALNSGISNCWLGQHLPKQYQLAVGSCISRDRKCKRGFSRSGHECWIFTLVSRSEDRRACLGPIRDPLFLPGLE